MTVLLSEEDTKTQRITPALQKAGWPLSQIVMEYNLKADRFRIVPDQNKTYKESSRTRADYVLFHSTNVPVAVLEAKSAAKTAEEGLGQAITYAKMLDVPFAYASSGDKFVEYNLKTGQQRTIPLTAFPSPADLWRRWCQAREVSPENETRLNDALYYTSIDGKVPRYYQMTAINKVVNAVIADRRKRLLLVMATGTGKTYTAFQIVWRLRKAGVIRNVLYLADRNQLIDQTLTGDFAPFSKIQTKIRALKKDGAVKKIDRNFEIYFGLYQQLKGNSDDACEDDAVITDYYKEVPSDYFDLIVVDECHRGSARDESRWHKILDCFKPSIHLGLTATPNEKDGADNRAYFGDPIYTYTLKQGIDDGFLAPFQVVSVRLDKDENGWEPQDGETDESGQLISKRLYTLKDFGTTIELKNRTDKVAEMVTAYLHHLGTMSKTIVFCNTQRHALAMRDALRRHNTEFCKVNPDYIVRMTADDKEGKDLYENFTSIKKDYPVVVTTSKLLTTGADTKCVKLIVLDQNITSMTEFKQIIGRGTRLREDAGKTFFTILDFRGACELFKDPKFDGDPGNVAQWGDGDPLPHSGNGDHPPKPPKPKPPVPPTPPRPPVEPAHPYVVGGGVVNVISKTVQYRDGNGKLVTERFEDYTRRNILELFGTEADFMAVWNGPEEKQVVIDRLQEKGVIFEALKREIGNPDLDEFDIVCSIAYGRVPMTRELRASKARNSKFLAKYQGVCRDVLETLLNIYARTGVANIDNRMVLKTEPFLAYGGPVKILREFGGKTGYADAVRDLENGLYLPENLSKNTSPEEGTAHS